MPEKTAVLVGKRRLELSNLEKVLFPEDGIIKARVIEYYLKIAPAMLRHLSGRPLSLVRFPDGIDGEAFFQKNRPALTPDWIPVEKIENIEYMVAREEATLAFLANLAAIEFHQMQIRPGISNDADYMVFDLDPPEGFGFSKVVEIALALREYLDASGYQPFVKTTGSKGLHLLVPIWPPVPYDTVFAETRRLATGFVAKNPITTLHIKKADRRGRVLLDIYRNRPGQTIVSAYSLRGKPGAPVSFPLSWEELAVSRTPAEFNLNTVPDLVARRGDAWEPMYAYSSRVGSSEKGHHRRAVGRIAEANSITLDDYKKKRAGAETPEPAAVPGTVRNENAYVVHRHHASRLHYDLRLEQDGVLKSWAVPKGLPPEPGIKRLAVQVEDHPLTYADFEGVIPEGRYGAGRVWVFSRGRYEITKRKKDGFYFRLNSDTLTAEYRMIHTREKEWLLERVDSAVFPASIEPMLAASRDSPPTGDYLYEVKWDGIRAIIYLFEGELRILSRSGRDITDLFPEIHAPEAFRASNGIFDGEIVCLDDQGRPLFRDVIRRIQQKRMGVERIRKKHPAVCYLFDCLYLDGRSLLKDHLSLRREWLLDAIREQGSFRFSQSFEDGSALLAAAAQAGLEGIMAKQTEGPYLPGRRSDQWIKVKLRKTADCLILGFTVGQAGRHDTLGSLQLAVRTEGSLRYAGRVGSGFDDRSLGLIRRQLEKRKTKSSPEGIDIPREDALDTVWVEPVEWCEIEYASLTEDGRFREPVFLRMRPDYS